MADLAHIAEDSSGGIGGTSGSDDDKLIAADDK